MELDPAACYDALCARDRRFDGVFFVGVTTTGIYCRPICPARTPGRGRCQFFRRPAEAERAGFRACFRCRPELAPGRAAVDSLSRLATAALARIDAGDLNDGSVDGLAQRLGVSGRHLRRALEAELGATPIELAQTRRLALAKQLLQDTALPPAEVAFAAGFASVRRFNALVQQRFGRPPSALRREGGEAASGDAIDLRLDYRPPLDWPALLTFVRGREVAGVEHVDDEGAYTRVVALGDRVGWLRVSSDPARPALRVRVALSLAPHLMAIVARLRGLFDLDAHPDTIAAHLRRDPVLRASVDAHPGLRVPGAFDGFELAARAVLGQQVSVRAATTLCARLVARFGRPVPKSLPGLTAVFPAPADLAAATVADVRAIGLPEQRARTLVALAGALAEGRLDLSLGADPAGAIAALEALPGIGPWTAQYIAMRALRWPDAFPGGDLVVRRALDVTTTRAAEARTAAWRPWRAYGVLHLWRTASSGG
ncbi:DNA-3-methyladenine glycosylase II [Nannocystis exedens]|uniref:DNA-3-methyladenine glycosylase II n=1 Tax=Nannocystis exedens TaxID=54 RepID=A0A1I1VXP5_9BACT|nr:DNA-3-methyladenine glycosylase 2 [Nannocystis exedens]PCC72928.1 adenosine deaminase [Nannocystis exedens]SFD87539.1 DNA-3-methyladenine glycosylase II [Nannocystis exedens]